MSVTLERAISELDPVVALLSLIQITGDATLLHKFGEALEGTQHQIKEAFVGFNPAPEPSEASIEVANEVRGLLLKAVQAGKPAVLPQLDKPLFRAMSRLALGHESAGNVA